MLYFHMIKVLVAKVYNVDTRYILAPTHNCPALQFQLIINFSYINMKNKHKSELI